MSQPTHYTVKKDPVFCQSCDETLGMHRWELDIFHVRHVFCSEKCASAAWKMRFRQSELPLPDTPAVHN